MWAFTDSVIVYIDDQLIGDTSSFISWAVSNYNYEDFRNEVLYETLRKEAYATHIASTKNDYVYMDFNYEEKSIGRIVFELYKNMLPKTSENFRMLCTGEKGRSEETATRLHYKNSIIHRIVEQGWMQGGGSYLMVI